MNISRVWKAMNEDPIFSQIIEIMKTEDFEPAPDKVPGEDVIVGEMSQLQKALLTLALKHVRSSNRDLGDIFNQLMWKSIRQTISSTSPILGIRSGYTIVEFVENEDKCDCPICRLSHGEGSEADIITRIILATVLSDL